MRQVKRPLSITIISWLLIAYGVVIPIEMLLYFTNLQSDLFYSLMYFNPFQIANGMARSLLDLVAGIAMLRRWQWGRWLFVGTSILTVFPWFIWSTGHYQIQGYILTSIGCGIVLFFIFRPSASAFFKGAQLVISDPTPINPTSTTLDNALSKPVKKPMQIVRKVIGGYILGFMIIWMGGWIAGFSFAFTTIDLGSSLSSVILGFLIGLVVGIGVIVAGVALWSWARWRKVLGVFLCILGGLWCLVDGSLIIVRFIFGIEFQRNATTSDITQALIYIGLAGLAALACGILALYRQHQLDNVVPRLPWREEE